jgi:phosphatidylglycerophosphatase A
VTPIDLRPEKNAVRAPLRPLNAATLALSVGGLGFLRPAPGTWGSMPPPAIAGILVLAGAGTGTMHAVVAGLLVLSSVACVLWGRYAEERFGRKDAAEVVADETAGVCPAVFVAIAMAEGLLVQCAALAGAFLLFRVFDIIKPAPARQLESLPAGWGVLIDDLVAGVYAALVLAGLLALRGLVG